MSWIQSNRQTLLDVFSAHTSLLILWNHFLEEVKNAEVLEAFHVVLGAFEKSSIIHKLRILVYKQLTALSSISGTGALICSKGPHPNTCLFMSSAGSSVLYLSLIREWHFYNFLSDFWHQAWYSQHITKYGFTRVSPTMWAVFARQWKVTACKMLPPVQLFPNENLW